MAPWKELEGWVSVAVAAKYLNMSRQAVHARIGRGSFVNVRVVPTGSDSRPFFLIDEAEVKELAASLVQE